MPQAERAALPGLGWAWPCNHNRVVNPAAVRQRARPFGSRCAVPLQSWRAYGLGRPYDLLLLGWLEAWLVSFAICALLLTAWQGSVTGLKRTETDVEDGAGAGKRQELSRNLQGDDVNKRGRTVWPSSPG